MAVARTNGVHEVDPSEFQGSIDFNRENKGYLALCHLGSLDGTKDLPLSAFSNAGAVIFAYSQRENPTLSHLSGYLRELKIPVLITPDYGEFEKIKKHGNYVVYANEFLDGGFLARA